MNDITNQKYIQELENNSRIFDDKLNRLNSDYNESDNSDNNNKENLLNKYNKVKSSAYEKNYCKTINTPKKIESNIQKTDKHKKNNSSPRIKITGNKNALSTIQSLNNKIINNVNYNK
jgi:hypothetical protein